MTTSRSSPRHYQTHLLIHLKQSNSRCQQPIDRNSLFNQREPPLFDLNLVEFSLIKPPFSNLNLVELSPISTSSNPLQSQPHRTLFSWISSLQPQPHPVYPSWWCRLHEPINYPPTSTIPAKFSLLSSDQLPIRSNSKKNPKYLML